MSKYTKLAVAEDGVIVRFTLANTAVSGESFPFLPESEDVVNSEKAVVVVTAVPADVVPRELPN